VCDNPKKTAEHRFLQRDTDGKESRGKWMLEGRIRGRMMGLKLKIVSDKEYNNQPTNQPTKQTNKQTNKEEDDDDEDAYVDCPNSTKTHRKWRKSDV
jgi:hypothetical protein